MYLFYACISAKVTYPNFLCMLCNNMMEDLVEAKHLVAPWALLRVVLPV